MPIQKKYLDSSGVKDLFHSVLDILDITTDTVQEAIDLKADVASPELTGTPTAPTPANGTNNTQIATTAFVMKAIKPCIRITGNVACAGYTATAILVGSNTQFTGTFNAAGIVSIPVDYNGEYQITYSDNHIKGDSHVTITASITYELACAWKNIMTYTLDIDETNSNASTACTYNAQSDANGMTKGAVTWNAMPIFDDIKPCIFKNGEVQYYLNPNDFTKKMDGTDAVLDGRDGDVMIEFRKFAYKIARDGTTLQVSVTNDATKYEDTQNGWNLDAFTRNTEGDLDKFYIGAFKGSIQNDEGTLKLRSIIGVQPTGNVGPVYTINGDTGIATSTGSGFTGTIGAFRTAAGNVGNNYRITNYAQLKAIQCLYLIKYGNRNGQEAIGKGITSVSDNPNTSNHSYITGYHIKAETTNANVTTVTSAPNGTIDSTLTSGMYWGGTNVQHIKAFGIEDFWGNIWEWVDGISTDSSWNLLTTINPDNFGKTTYTDDGTVTREASGLNANSSRWIKDVFGTNASGFMSKAYGGSSSTYWADYGALSGGRVARFGGSWADDDGTGPFDLRMNRGVDSTYRDIGARLLYV